MDLLDKFNNAISYIEENLDNDIEYDKAAQIASCSVYHFQRMFNYIANVSLAEYIRRRRLTLAAFELQNSKIKIIDLAIKYGYDSPISFTRAFQKLQGITPSYARNRGVQLKAYPRISFNISVTGSEEVNYKIINKESFIFVGKGTTIKTPLNDVLGSPMYSSISDFYVQTTPLIFDTFPNRNFIGVCTNYKKNTNEFTFYLGVEESGNMSKEFCEICIPEGTWAVFKAVGIVPESIEQIRKRIYTEWFPISDYDYRDNLVLEMQKYLQGDQNDPNYICEIWIPVKKRI